MLKLTSKTKNLLNRMECRLARYKGLRVPIENKKIVIDNFLGCGYGDNPKYIAEEIRRKDPDVDIVWLINDRVDVKEFPIGIRTVKIGSPKAAYEYATAHIWIDNVKSNFKGMKRPEQFYLQTWHGGIALKKIEKAVESQLDPGYVEASKEDSKITDAILSDSKWVTDSVRENFWYDGEILETGFPRNDAFFNNTKEAKERVRRFFYLSPNTKIVLYAPTFRNNVKIEDQRFLYEVNGIKIKEACEKKFGGQYAFLERVHPNVASQINLPVSEFVKSANDYPDMQDLLVSADVLITDFSSSVFDFILNKHRVFLFAKDYEQYISSERELNFNIKKDLPFSFANSETELIQNISSYDDKKGKINVEKLINSFGLKEDGHASERVAKILLNVMKEKNN